MHPDYPETTVINDNAKAEQTKAVLVAVQQNLSVVHDQVTSLDDDHHLPEVKQHLDQARALIKTELEAL